MAYVLVRQRVAIRCRPSVTAKLRDDPVVMWNERERRVMRLMVLSTASASSICVSSRSVSPISSRSRAKACSESVLPAIMLYI